jgi:hypothetical protein
MSRPGLAQQMPDDIDKRELPVCNAANFIARLDDADQLRGRCCGVLTKDTPRAFAPKRDRLDIAGR